MLLVKIGLVYFSNTDVTGKLMTAMATELGRFPCEVVEHRVEAQEIVEGRFVPGELFSRLHTCQAIIFGSPTYMGGVAAQFKAFADATSDFWAEQRWAGMLAAGVTSGTGLNGDQASTLTYLQLLASQHGMLWIGLDTPYNHTPDGMNRLGCQLGVTAQSNDGRVHESDMASAKYLAARVYRHAAAYNSLSMPDDVE
ncbi:NAD(P)H-dependent oxidoreductase [Alteromonas sp. ASW11-19]|uniref:NAD(P)H-dependent oxidoreductase n=1 Tax=Alteromonas salexigens TaxID=2982530 RepID=A0ABT2VKF8_9ALTE|nr:NAD(P)H-dependent oxidoreductase [Alteromonas salexigens]MCU7553775.1 NAD(P)H-dependent oxidoreductase [Alteromonas salexigens]